MRGEERERGAVAGMMNERGLGRKEEGVITTWGLFVLGRIAQKETDGRGELLCQLWKGSVTMQVIVSLISGGLD